MKTATKLLALNLALLLLLTVLLPAALAAGAIAIRVGETVSGVGDGNAYTFTPEEDGHYSFDFDPVAVYSTCPYLELYSLRGTQDENGYKLSAGQTYSFSVEGGGHWTGGTNSFTLTIVKNQTEEPDDLPPQPDDDFSSELPTFTADPATALADIPYVLGDRGQCKMDAAMASAYIKAIEQARTDMLNSVGYGRDGAAYDSQYDELYVALADPAGDGYPILITAVLDKVGAPGRYWMDWADGSDKGGMVGECLVWSYRDGVATKGPEVEDYGLLNGEPVLYREWWALDFPTDGQDFGGYYYTVSQGEVTLAREVTRYAYSTEYATDLGTIDSRCQLKFDGNYPVWIYATVDGVDVTDRYDIEDGIDSLIGRRTQTGYLFSGTSYGAGWCCVDTVPADQAIAALQALVPTAYASTQTVEVDGRAVEFQCYALKDAAGNDTNFIKLRDLAQILNGTGARFEVTWDGAVNIRPGRPYTPNGSELSTPYSGNRAYEAAFAETRVNGRAVALGAILLKDDGGNGYTYYKLRDLARALGFNVGWSDDQGVYVETDKPYDPNN